MFLRPLQGEGIIQAEFVAGKIPHSIKVMQFRYSNKSTGITRLKSLQSILESLCPDLVAKRRRYNKLSEAMNHEIEAMPFMFIRNSEAYAQISKRENSDSFQVLVSSRFKLIFCR